METEKKHLICRHITEWHNAYNIVKWTGCKIVQLRI